MTKARVNADNASADIQGVTAGTGLTGGGTSGTVTLTNGMATAIDAKGDLVVGTGADTFSRLAAGSNGDTIVADASTAVGLSYQGNYAAGKNKIINGNFGVWQRGTSFTLTGTGGYTADRFEITSGGGGVVTVTQGAFTPGSAPLAGVESQYFLNLNYTTSGTGAADNGQYIEDVRTFAGQTVTVSVYAKVSSGTHSITPQLVQRFGSGGSGAGATSGTTFTATTSWQRFTATINVPSVSGKTIGAGSSLQFRLDLGTTGVKQFQFWGFQVEAGSVATAFQTATGTIQGELAACQRYYYRQTADQSYTHFSTTGTADGTTSVHCSIAVPVSMRVNPTSLDFSTLALIIGGSVIGISTLAISANQSSRFLPCVQVTTTGLTNNLPYSISANNSTSAFLGLSAEL